MFFKVQVFQGPGPGFRSSCEICEKFVYNLNIQKQ